jgi:hypothetical protein
MATVSVVTAKLEAITLSRERPFENFLVTTTERQSLSISVVFSIQIRPTDLRVLRRGCQEEGRMQPNGGLPIDRCETLVSRGKLRKSLFVKQMATSHPLELR